MRQRNQVLLDRLLNYLLDNLILNGILFHICAQEKFYAIQTDELKLIFILRKWFGDSQNMPTNISSKNEKKKKRIENENE